jgi:hypothetical protein
VYGNLGCHSRYKRLLLYISLILFAHLTEELDLATNASVDIKTLGRHVKVCVTSKSYITERLIKNILHNVYFEKSASSSASENLLEWYSK